MRDMKRRDFLVALGTGALAAHTRRAAAQSANTDDTAEGIYNRSISIDVMCFGAAPPRNYVTYLTEDKVEALRHSGITALSMNMVSGESRLGGVECMFAEAKKMIGEWDSFVSRHSDVLTRVTDTAGLRAVKRSGKVGFIYNFQMSAPFGWDLAKLDAFHAMGVRQIQFTGDRRNFLADSCWEPTNAGLSRYGGDAGRGESVANDAAPRGCDQALARRPAVRRIAVPRVTVGGGLSGR